MNRPPKSSDFLAKVQWHHNVNTKPTGFKVTSLHGSAMPSFLLVLVWESILQAHYLVSS